ncbi:polysaccharide biosynthesis/export family protein [Blastomonas sp. CCH10-E1]|uniref:polysaccharide biosynthesis/export family protein n=2 Tax=Sphingomonadales TaxID=204457 RepID=UPI001922F741|nr:polysaccharide biosynthesis/export family protein [Blastomonas sp. CCH10-E1]
MGLAEDIEVTQLENLPAPRLDISYVIGPQEKLEIQVVGAESLSGTYLTDVDGDLAFPLIGNVKLDGRSPSEAAREIADRLRGRYLRDPQVRVIPEEFPEPTISVGGQVKKPGSYPATGRPTLLRAVNQAEGMTQYAKQSDVLVLRTVENQRYIGVYDIRAIQRGNYADPQLFPNDIVIVGDSPERRRLDLLLQLVPPLLTTATILIVQQ